MTLNLLPSHSLARQRGFTLLEVLITMIVLSILMAIAIPNFREFNLSAGATAQINGLLGNLNTARSEALKTATNVRVTPASGGWTNGWTIMVDRNMNGTLDSADGDRIVAASEKVRTGLVLDAVTDPGNAAVPFFYYGPSGNILNPASALRFKLNRSGSPVAGRRCIQVDLSGRAEVRRGGATCPA